MSEVSLNNWKTAPRCPGMFEAVIVGAEPVAPTEKVSDTVCPFNVPVKALIKACPFWGMCSDVSGTVFPSMVKLAVAVEPELARSKLIIPDEPTTVPLYTPLLLALFSAFAVGAVVQVAQVYDSLCSDFLQAVVPVMRPAVKSRHIIFKD